MVKKPLKRKYSPYLTWKAVALPRGPEYPINKSDNLPNEVNLHFSKRLAVAVSLEIPAFGLVLHDVDLLVAAVSQDRRHHLGACDVGSPHLGRLFIIDKEHLVKSHLSVLHVGKFLYFERISFRNLVLFSARLYDCKSFHNVKEYTGFSDLRKRQIC